MSGLFSVDGVDIPELLAEHLGPRLLPVVLHRPGAAGARDPNDLTAAPSRAAGTDHTARGYFEAFSSGEVDGNLILTGDRKLVILAATIKPAIVPEPGPDRDEATVEGARYSLPSLLDRDAAGATYTLQARTR